MLKHMGLFVRKAHIYGKQDDLPAVGKVNEKDVEK